MSLQLVNQTVKKTYKEENVEDFVLTYNFEKEGDKVLNLNCSANKVPQANTAPVPGQPQYYGSCFFNHTSGGSFVNSSTFNHCAASEALTAHVQETFEQILAE